jgi:hypothetical protein
MFTEIACPALMEKLCVKSLHDPPVVVHVMVVFVPFTRSMIIIPLAVPAPWKKKLVIMPSRGVGN